jgi:hypothetical protein
MICFQCFLSMLRIVSIWVLIVMAFVFMKILEYYLIYFVLYELALHVIFFGLGRIHAVFVFANFTKYNFYSKINL